MGTPRLDSPLIITSCVSNMGPIQNGRFGNPMYTPLLEQKKICLALRSQVQMVLARKRLCKSSGKPFEPEDGTY